MKGLAPPLRVVAQLLASRSMLAAIAGLATWPKFSVTSFLLARRLRALGVVPTLIIDVGANEGQFALAVRAAFPDARLIAFEPQGTAFDRLLRNLRGQEGVECHRLALGAEVGEAMMHVTSDHRSSSLRPLGRGHLDAFPETVEAARESVPVRPLDEVLDVPAGATMLVKLDVQGFEDEVVRGASRTLAATRWVLMECSFRPMYQGESALDDMIRLMSAHGFELSRVVDVLWADNHLHVVQADVLFQRVDVRAADANTSGPHDVA